MGHGIAKNLVEKGFPLAVRAHRNRAPIDDHGDLNEYALVVYERGAAMFCALEKAMQGTLDEFLANYYHTYAFSIASREDFETLLRDFTGEDWSPLLSDYLDTYILN